MPEPTEEDLLLNEAYLEELEKKKQRKRIWLAAAVFAGLLVVGAATSIGYYGFSYVKDTVFGHPTKELLEEEWVQSSYGYPPIDIATPKVLLRQEVKLPEELKAQISGLQAFGYRSSLGMFTVMTTSTTFAEANEPDFEKPIEQLLQGFAMQQQFVHLSF